MTMSIDTFLHELADVHAPVKSGRLSRLSNLDDDERRSLASIWPSLPVERRRTVLEQLTALAEDDPELDFDVVHLNALDDADAVVRRLGIEGLWEREGRDVIEPLMRLVRDDPDTEVRSAAAMALGRFVLLGEFGDLRPRDQVRVTDTLRAVVTDYRETPDVRARALESVGASSQPWARELIEDAYGSGDDRMIAGALHAMGRSADTYWLPTLIQELQSGDPALRFEAAGALGAIEEEEAVPHLAEVLDDEDTEVQEAAIQALGDIGGDEALSILRQRLNDADDRTRTALEAAIDQAEFGNDPLGIRP
ncbi:MAG: HEAT repeat domain-containing protein [Chloroflexi bacterium]|nr:HEAT repeat domain-containing protein [Chloroflexota bacterium]